MKVFSYRFIQHPSKYLTVFKDDNNDLWLSDFFYKAIISKPVSFKTIEEIEKFIKQELEFSEEIEDE